MANVIARAGRSHTVLTSAARTATPDTQELDVPWGARAATFVLDVTASAATPSIVWKVEGVDRASGAVFALLTGAAVTGVSTNVYRVGPDLAAVANVTALNYLPPVIRITVTHGDADSITYSVGANFQ